MMYRRVLFSTVSVVAYLATIGFAEAQRKPPKKPEQQFLVFVYTEGLTNEDVDMPRVTEEVSKRIAKKKRWLKVVDSRDRADIVVEVLTHVVNTQSRTVLDYRVDDQGIGKHLYENTFVSEKHRIETRITLPDGTQKIFTGADERDHGSMKRAATDLADQLEEHCKENYWDFVSS
jgi:hypothetical protein